MSRVLCIAVGSALAVASPSYAQSEAALKDYFEGRTVVVKIAMPGTAEGVDVYPGESRSIDFTRHGERMKQYGTALSSGQSALVTKVKVKDKLIEFQLDGGGYGTFGDDTNTSTYIPSAGKSGREEDLDREIKAERDPGRKKSLERERDRLRDQRHRRDAENRSIAEANSAIKAQTVADKRLRGGSRFNIRFPLGTPGDALHPQAVLAALGPYVDFGDDGRRASVRPVSNPVGSAGTENADLKQGMTPLEVMDIMGKPDREVAFGNSVKWTYPDVTVIFENGRLKEVKF